MSSRSDLARTAMIHAAEQIAAERGLGQTTLSEVQQRAGQANKSAARYHFGSRDGLLDAVLERRMAPVDAHRRELLEASAGVPLGHAEVAAVFVRPLAAQTLGRPGSTFARFLMQALSDPTQSARVLEHVRAASFRDLRERFRAATPLPAPLAELRFGSLVMLSVATLATWEGHRDEAGIPVDLVVDDLVRTATAVLDAPTQP
ncbi:TetR/AcrR family transcriptional regulator [Nocardioides daejeonensis]|uniref:TetR/AcrR family transcriptional regulator n=1 Tax=Nocardioides daejeonensis TaxID=1046556 RepID=UPI00194E8C1A|nr:TetR/AcrR family transcriptional regulator [Nocardioides daejeonensis]